MISAQASSSTLVENLATHDKNTEQTYNESIKIKETKEIEKIERQKLN